MPPKKCPKCLVTHGYLFVSSWTKIHGQIKRTRLRSTPRVRPDLPRGASPGVKTKTDWLDWPYHDVANATSAKLPSGRARPPLCCVVVFFVCPCCFFVVLLRQRKQKFVRKAFLVFAFLICILRTPDRSPFFFLFFGEELEPFSFLELWTVFFFLHNCANQRRLPTVPSSWH